MRTFPSVVDRSVIVTGASRGLGRAMAIGFLEAGARVTLACRGRLIKRCGGPRPLPRAHVGFVPSAICVSLPIANSSPRRRLRLSVELAAIPNNGDGEPFWQIGTDDWRRFARTNCDSVFFMSRSVIAGILARRSARSSTFQRAIEPRRGRDCALRSQQGLCRSLHARLVAGTLWFRSDDARALPWWRRRYSRRRDGHRQYG